MQAITTFLYVSLLLAVRLVQAITERLLQMATQAILLPSLLANFSVIQKRILRPLYSLNPQENAIYALPKLPRQHMPHYEPDTCPLSMHVTAVHPLILSLVSNDVGITGINYRRMASRNRFP